MSESLLRQEGNSAFDFIVCPLSEENPRNSEADVIELRDADFYSYTPSSMRDKSAIMRPLGSPPRSHPIMVGPGGRDPRAR